MRPFIQMRGYRLLVLLLASGLAVEATEYSRPIREALNAIRQEKSKEGLPRLEGHTEGYPGRSGAFFLYYRQIYGNVTQQDVEDMLKDPSPAIRLVGAMVAINLGWDPNVLTALSTDTAKLLVGPLDMFNARSQIMTVSQVLVEMRNNPRFLVHYDYSSAVHLDYIKKLTGGKESYLVQGDIPRYPFDMGRAGVNGHATARLRFAKGSDKPVIQIVQSSHQEFADALTWALAKWTLHDTASRDSSTDAVEFECRIVFMATE